jgi:hypothetical protein
MPQLTEVNNLATTFIFLCDYDTDANNDDYSYSYIYYYYYYIGMPNIGRRTADNEV